MTEGMRAGCPSRNLTRKGCCPWALPFIFILATSFATLALAQGQSESPSPAPGPNAVEETIVPTFETQTRARTYILDIPAPRGLITDRNGTPLAQNRLSYNLAISFPPPLDFSDPQLLAFAHEKIQAAEKLLGRSLKISDDLIKRHYRNRG